ncbi:hypothetical protein CD149_06035 [Staphylococcus condimenti]|nr:hypothetical protein CD149_06035 [Staphylococcus condimenti]
MKKVLFLLLASFLVLGACGQKDDSKSDDNKSETTKKETKKDDKEKSEKRKIRQKKIKMTTKMWIITNNQKQQWKMSNRLMRYKTIISKVPQIKMLQNKMEHNNNTINQMRLNKM